MSEEEFRSRLFVELSEEQPPPMGALVSAAEFDGVKLRRRRRIVQIVGGTAGVTAVAFAATAVAGGIGTGQATASAAAGGTSTPAAAPTTAAAAPTPAATPAQPAKAPGSKTDGTPEELPRNWQTAPDWMQVLSPAAKPDGGKAVTPQAAAALLESLVTETGGAGSFSHVYGRTGAASVGSSSNTAPGYSATVFWNQGTIDVQYMAKPLYQLGCEASENQNGNVCYDYKLADGTEVNYFKLVGTAGATEVKAQKGQANLTINRPDGSQILVLEINGPETGSTGPTRADEPLTEEQLWHIAGDPRWAPTMDASFVAQANHTIKLASEPF